MKAGKLQRINCIFKNLEHFYYTNSELSERKIKKRIPFKIVSKRILNLEQISSRRIKTYILKAMTLMKETEHTKVMEYLCLQIGSINVTMSIKHLKASIDSIQSLSKFQNIFLRSRTNNPKMCGNHMDPKSQSNTEKEKQSGDITLHDFKVY